MNLETSAQVELTESSKCVELQYPGPGVGGDASSPCSLEEDTVSFS